MYQGVVVDRWSAVFEATMRAGRESGGKARRRLRAKSQLTELGPRDFERRPHACRGVFGEQI